MRAHINAQVITFMNWQEFWEKTTTAATPSWTTVPRGRKLIGTPSLSAHCVFSSTYNYILQFRPDWISRTLCWPGGKSDPLESPQSVCEASSDPFSSILPTWRRNWSFQKLSTGSGGQSVRITRGLVILLLDKVQLDWRMQMLFLPRQISPQS